jgi:hypothetical protein
VRQIRIVLQSELGMRINESVYEGRRSGRAEKKPEAKSRTSRISTLIE